MPPPPAPAWELREGPPAPVIDRLCAELSLPRALCTVLAVRGLGDPAAARAFLRPRLDDLPDPTSLVDAPAAAARLGRALDHGERIFVHGDYDVDGICAAALLTLRLRELGGDVVPFVPHRMRDGYDLGAAGLAAAREAGARLLVTCDSGISAHETIRTAVDAGIDVIVTDHHTPGPDLPPACAVVDPARADCGYAGEGGLCGTGVAFEVLRLLGHRRGRPDHELLVHLDLVALATIADLVPLIGPNRTLVRFGLRYLAHTSKPGLRALIEASGLADAARRDALEAGAVGFVLAPRINAVGRMGDAADGLRLLLTRDPAEAQRLAGELEAVNTRRQAEDQRMLAEALELLASNYDPEQDFGVVLAREGWHPGVIGIVASRVVERIHRPTILVALDGASGRGSARSVPGLHLHEALTACGEHLERFGGHRAAAGMDVHRDRVDGLRRAFGREVRERFEGCAPRPVLRVDATLEADEITPELHRWLDYVGPFGMGNPRPAFVARSVRARGGARVVGRDHLKLDLGISGLDAIGFGLASRVGPAACEGPLDLAFQLRENEYRGRRTLQLRLLDVRAARVTAGGPAGARALSP